MPDIHPAKTPGEPGMRPSEVDPVGERAQGSRAPWAVPPPVPRDAGPGSRAVSARPPPLPKTADPRPDADLVKRPPRLCLVVEVTLESESCFYSGLTENISEGGLFVATYDLRPPGTRFSVSLTVEGMPPIEVTAEVRWVRDSHGACAGHDVGMGMAFVDLAEDDRATIQAFLDFRSPLLIEGI
jgi:uncharacterized protein (TIGR02266 family)